jgi:hypothetical protein
MVYGGMVYGGMVYGGMVYGGMVYGDTVPLHSHDGFTIAFAAQMSGAYGAGES